VQCFFKDLKEIQICDDKNITTTTLEHTVHNLKSNATYYFQVRAHTEIIAGPYTDLINVSTTHENPIPKLLVTTDKGIDILDLDSNIFINLVEQSYVQDIAYSVQEHRIYWIRMTDLMTLEINKNNITRITTFLYFPRYLCIDWVARNLYLEVMDIIDGHVHIIKFDLTMWKNGIIKHDEILSINGHHSYEWTSSASLKILPSIGYVYYRSFEKVIIFKIS